MAGRGPDERWGRLARLDRGEVKARPSGFPEERPERRNATVERRRARVPSHNGTRAPSPRCPVVTLRLNRRSLPRALPEGKKEDGGSGAVKNRKVRSVG